MKTKLILSATMFFCSLWAIAQENSTIGEIDTLLTKKDKKIFTPTALNKSIYSKINVISGVNLKEGKVVSRSASIDDKSLTVNYAIKCGDRFFVQPSVSGTSEDGFLSVFSTRKYQKTLSGGVSFQLFSGHNSIFYDGSNDAEQLHTQMRVKKVFYDSIEKMQNYRRYKELVDSFKAIYENALTRKVLTEIDNHVSLSYPIDTLQLVYKNKNLLDSIVDQLIKYKILNEKFRGETYEELYDEITYREVKKIENAVEQGYLIYQDSLQLNSKVGTSVKWLSSRFNYNNDPQNVLTNKEGTSPSKFYNEYVTATLAGNRLRIYRNDNKWYLTIGASYSSIRDFDPKNQKISNFVSTDTLGRAPVQNIDSTITYYTSVPARANKLSLDISSAIFFGKSNFGLEFGMSAGTNDPSNNNVNGRIGVYIPFGSDDNLVFVEPLIKFDRLFSSGKNDFLKDNLGIGFNLSVSLPAFLKK